MKKIIFCFLFFWGGILNAQIIVENTTRTPTQLVENVLVGQGVTPLNIKFNGNAINANLLRDQASYFKANFNPTNLGFLAQSEGVLLTTGKGIFALGPNTSHNSTATGQMPSSTANGPDADLALLSGMNIFNSAILEFDFVATGLELSFDFIFGSEEYAGYVNQINDAFGFFLSGPGINGIYSNGAKNIALVPNTNIPVSINTINNGPNNNGSCVNCTYYFNNGPTGMNPNTSTDETVEYDGFTKVLQAKSALQCGQTYHIKLAIGNAGDNLLDSGVFLKNFSIKPMQLRDNLNLSENTGVCNGKEIIVDSGLTDPAYEYEWTTIIGSQSTVITNAAGIPVESPTLTLNQVAVPPATPDVDYPFWISEIPKTYKLNVYVTYPPAPPNPGYRCMFASDSIVLSYLPKIPILLNTPIKKAQCTVLPPPYVINLYQEADLILGAGNLSNYILGFYDTNGDDAFNGAFIGSIQPDNISGNWPYTINDNNPHTVWIRIEDILTGCIRVEPISYSFGPEPSGEISYPDSPYCIVINTAQPITTDVTSGGIYSSSPAGLSIDPNTGDINPSLSTPGNYIVNYNLAASINCPAFSPPPANISINLTPTPVFSIVQPTCTVNTGSITFTAPVGPGFEYSIDNGITFQSSLVFAVIPSGTAYDAVVRNVSLQCTSEVVSGVLNPVVGVPASPIASPTVQPTCSATTATIEISFPLGATLQYSINGGTTFQAASTFAGLVAGTTYSVTVKDIVTGCVSAATAVLIDPIPGAPTPPIATVTQPSCLTVAGISITAPLGANLEYSIDGGANFQAGTDFNSLTSNSYNIIVRNITTGCVSATSTFVVNSMPSNPLTPVAVITQPTCSTITGSFSVFSPLSTSFEYSLDSGTTYQTGIIFSGLLAGTNYNLIVRNTLTGCVSAASVVIILPVLTAPATPTASVTAQPTCTAPTGTIAITAPLGANLQYSADGGTTYQSNITFAGLTPNTTFSLTVKNTTSGCISTTVVVAVNALPAAPATPNAIVVAQPNCTIPTGTIQINSPLGSNLVYSNNGGISYQAVAIFSGLSPNTAYSFTVRNLVTGCVSLATSITINPIPNNLTAPVVSLTQPTCVVSTGTILFTAPIGTDLLYSIDGGISYQASTLFAAVSANITYSALVKNNVTGCVSSISLLTINPSILLPATPVAFANNTCSGESISLSTSAVAGATYHWSGPNGFVSSIQNPVITNATVEMSGTYTIVVYLTPDCPSLPGSISIFVNPLPTPGLQNGHICVDSVNTVVNPYLLNAGIGDSAYTFEWFVVNGATYTPITDANLSEYAVDIAGIYAVRATSKATGCVSDVITATVILSPTPNQINVLVSDYFSEVQTITVNASPAGNYQFQLDNGAPQSANIFMNVASGTHQIIIKSECGTFRKEVFIMDFPKYFTPNGDGYNETWNIFDLNTQANAKIYIFDRFGKLLKEISPSSSGWDGTCNQNSLPSSDYWFIVHYAENNINKVFKSHFALKR